MKEFVKGLWLAILIIAIGALFGFGFSIMAQKNLVIFVTTKEFLITKGE